MFATFVAIVALIAAAPALIDQEKLKAKFLADIGQWIGSEVTSRGQFQLSLFPEFKATLADVVSTEAASPVQLSARSIEIGISPWPALIGRIDSSSIQFNEADIIVHAQTGDTLAGLWRVNPLGSIVESAGRQMVSDASATDLSSVRNAKLGLVTLNQSTFTAIAKDGSKEQISNIDGSLNWPSLRSSAHLDAVAKWRGETLDIKAQIMDPLGFLAGDNSSLSLNVASTPMTLSFVGKGNLVANFFADGDVSWKTPSMRRFLQWLRTSSTAGESIGEIELNAKLVTKDGKLNFNDVAMSVSDSVASGTLVIDPVVKPIKSSGTLAFKKVDLAALAASLPIGADGQVGDELRVLDNLDVDLRLSAESATIGGYVIANAAGAIRIAKGDASIDLGTGDIAGGTIMGRLELTGPATNKTGHLIAALRKLQLDQVSDLPAGIPVFSGPLSGKLEIAGPYLDLRTLLATGNGTFNLELDPGVVRNFNLEAMQSAVETQSNFELPSVYAGMSEAREFSLNALIKSGVIVVNDAKAVIDGRRVLLTGAIPLLSRGIALNGVITDIDPGASTKPLPFFVGGTWWKPMVTTQAPK
ncbi:MAG: AsmA family protein [Rhizobiaceae bacterium]